MTSKKRGTTGGSPPRPPAPPKKTAWAAPGSAHDAPDEDSPHPVEETAPCTPSPGLLSPMHQRFCQEYLHDLNGTQAYMRANPDVKNESARVEASRLLARPNIRLEIQRLMDERAAVTGITADRVLLRMWQMATADTREFMELRIGCCRHCWGLYHQYQYTDAELEKAEADHIHAEAKRRKAEKGDFKPKEFHSKGGAGFDPKRQPNEECPECWGQGKHQYILKDTRNLSPGAAMLFAGIKVTDAGTQVLLRDTTPVLLKIGEHLGLWSDKLPGPAAADPLRALLEELRGASGTAAALPIVHNDPERREPGPEIEDVVAKPSRPAKKPVKQWKPIK